MNMTLIIEPYADQWLLYPLAKSISTLHLYKQPGERANMLGT